MLAAPAAATGATRTVEAGQFGKASRAAFSAAQTDANAYFRRVVTVRRGDRVNWDINGFHTVTFVPRDGEPPALIVPDAATPIAGSLDAAGQPFWFNGQPRLTYNLAAVLTQGGSTFEPRKLHNSGLPIPEPRPYSLKFRKTGRFRYLCLVHPGMTGAVRVVGSRRSIPSATEHRRAAKREQRALLRRAQRLTTGLGSRQRENTIQAGNDTRDGVAVLKFFPRNATVEAGSTVNLRMSPRTTEAHTFTFGPADYLQQLITGFQGVPEGGNGGPPTFVVDPRAALPSENPGAQGPPAYDGANHGNGFFNTGVLDRDPNTPQPDAVPVTFTKAGVYGYLCIIHPNMRGRVTVAP